jgi:hypothetical protein
MQPKGKKKHATNFKNGKVIRSTHWVGIKGGMDV